MPSLRFEGSATIQSAAEAKARLCAALAEGGDVAVDCSGVDEVDVTFLQVLVAAHCAAARRGSFLRLLPSAPVLAAIGRAGVTLPPGLMPD